VLENQRDEQHARADALEGEIAALRDCVAELSERATQAEAQVSAFLATKTFRYTTPVRRAYLKLRSASQKSSTLASVRRRIAFQGGAGTFQEVRQALATHHLRGEGLEIGALHQPLTVPSEATVRYVDRLTVEELREHYPELAQYDLVEPDLIDDGERLSSVSDSSVDFVIANHFIEHCEDPIGALSNLLRVTRTGGIVYMAVPDKRRIFDRERPETTIEHLDRDHRDGPGWSKERHYDEYARLVDHAADPAAHARQLRERDYSIHFHVWTPTTFEEFVDHCRRVHRLPFEVAEFVPDNDFEFIAILRKTDGQIQNLQP
jgi:predicted SAM-dependent methyltransferase